MTKRLSLCTHRIFPKYTSEQNFTDLHMETEELQKEREGTNKTKRRKDKIKNMDREATILKTEMELIYTYGCLRMRLRGEKWTRRVPAKLCCGDLSTPS